MSYSCFLSPNVHGLPLLLVLLLLTTTNAAAVATTSTTATATVTATANLLLLLLVLLLLSSVGATLSLFKCSQRHKAFCWASVVVRVGVTRRSFVVESVIPWMETVNWRPGNTEGEGTWLLHWGLKSWWGQRGVRLISPFMNPCGMQSLVSASPGETDRKFSSAQTRREAGRLELLAAQPSCAHPPPLLFYSFWCTPEDQ